jgi:heat shock protein HslJ
MKWALAILVVVTAGACSTQGVAPPPLSGHWDLIELAGAKVGEENRPNVVFTDEGVSGFTGCNQFQGGFEQERDTLKFGPLASTRMFCEASADLETNFMAMLGNTTRFKLTRDRLSFLAEDEVLARFRPTGHELAPYR